MRRVVGAIRIVFYAGVLLIGVPLVVAIADPEEPYATLAGRTSQGHAVELDLQRGRPAFFSVRVAARCPWAEPWVVTWARVIGDEPRVEHRSARTYDDGWTGDRRVTLEVRGEDGDASGRVSLVEELRDARGRRYVCESGDVTFSLVR